MAAEDGCGGGWTDEKHTSFLNCMEASFVSCMLFGGQFTYAAATPLPLDRCLPDGADSTADCPAGKRGMGRTSARLREDRRGFSEGLRRIRKRRLQMRHTAPRCQDDQVVPEFELRKSGENARLLHASGTVPPAATDDQPTVVQEKDDDLPSFR